VNFRRRILSIAGWTIAGSFAAVFAFSGATWQTPWRTILGQTFVNMAFSGWCVALCTFGLPWVVPRARRWFVFPLNWLAVLVALVMFGTVGSLLGSVIGMLSGVVPSSITFTAWYLGALRVSVYFTVIFGLSAAALEEARARLVRTTLALQKKELDEAEAQRLAAEAQLASLEARVDPHFLFNTLNAIVALVRDNPRAAERVIEQLAVLMRSSLDRGASLVPLDDELTLVRSYLEIEHLRFGDRLRFCIDAEPGVEHAIVPRLALQTLVENSVKHAVSPARAGATIRLNAVARSQRLQIAVEDDGPGFDASDFPEGHGLELLKNRLAMTFGADATLVTHSQPGCTRVALDLPFITSTRTRPGERETKDQTEDITCL
jgi:two-component system, LytTR family, sensor histidine kinase AlgZ